MICTFACVLYVMFCVVARIVLLLCLFVVCLVACGGCVFVFVFLRMFCVCRVLMFVVFGFCFV